MNFINPSQILFMKSIPVFKGRLSEEGDGELLKRCVEACRNIKNFNSYGIEIYTNESTLRVSIKKQFNEISKVFSDDCKVIVFHPPVGWAGSGYASFEKEFRIKSIKTLDACLTLSSKVNKNFSPEEFYFILHPSRFVRGYPLEKLERIKEKMMERNRRFITKFSKGAERSGIKLLIENMPCINDIGTYNLPNGALVGIGLDETEELADDSCKVMEDIPHFLINRVFHNIINQNLTRDLRRIGMEEKDLERISEALMRFSPEAYMGLKLSESSEFEDNWRCVLKRFKNFPYMHVADSTFGKGLKGRFVEVDGFRVREADHPKESSIFPWKRFRTPRMWALEVKDQYLKEYEPFRRYFRALERFGCI